MVWELPSAAMDQWDRGFPFSPAEFQALTDEEDMEEFRSEKNVTTGMVCIVVGGGSRSHVTRKR